MMWLGGTVLEGPLFKWGSMRRAHFERRRNFVLNDAELYFECSSRMGANQRLTTI